MKPRIALLALIAVLALGAWAARKLHWHNFLMGRKEITQLREYLGDRSPQRKAGHRFLYIAHAGGAYRTEPYLNTLEVINASDSLGVDYLEVDIHYTADSAVVLAHDFVPIPVEDFLEDRHSGTHLTLAHLMDWLENKDIRIITDVKTNNLRILRELSEKYPDLVHKIIPQAYSLNEMIALDQLGYRDIIYTNYISTYPNVTLRELASTGFAFAITAPYDINFRLLMSDQFSGSSTPFLTHTINDRALEEKLKDSGCGGIYTDFLLYPSIPY